MVCGLGRAAQIRTPDFGERPGFASMEVGAKASLFETRRFSYRTIELHCDMGTHILMQPYESFYAELNPYRVAGAVLRWCANCIFRPIGLHANQVCGPAAGRSGDAGVR